jgi:septum site-determining protein MinD
MGELLKVGVVSGKGGVGKTTVTLNLGLALYRLGVNVILVDGNISTPNLALYLGVLKTENSLNDVLSGRVHISNSVYEHSSGIKIVPSDLGVDAIRDVDFKRLGKVLPHLGRHADVLLVDSCAGLGGEAQRVLEVVDEVIIVTNDDRGALVDALKTIETCKRIGTPVIGVVLNKVRGRFDKLKIESLLGVPVISVIRHDKKIFDSTESGNVYLETYRGSNVDSFYDVAGKFLGGSYVKKLKKRDRVSLFNYVLNQLGLKR